MNSGRGCWDVKPVSSVNALGPDIEPGEMASWAEGHEKERDGRRIGAGTGIPGVRCSRQTGSMLPVCSRAFKQRVIDWLRFCSTNQLEIFALAFSGRRRLATANEAWFSLAWGRAVPMTQ